jgi:ABC-type amino acid transport substrate-binding protein
METANRPGSTTSQDPARFVDILVPVLSLVAVIFFLSFLYASSLSSEVSADEEQVRSLTEQLGTLHEQLRDALTANQLKVIETSIPHPDSKDRDSQAIGDHVTVGWSYPDNYSGKYVNFEIDLIKLDCDRSQSKCEHRYVTSDGASNSSRVPTGSAPLEPGFYAWRVAPVPAATVINENLDADDINPLSEWSNLGSFTLYRSLLDRVNTTSVVRVGTNLEQDTRFSQRTSDGTIQGLDVSLIYTLIEKCLDRSEHSHPVRFNRAKCSAEIDEMIARDRDGRQSLKSRSDSCSKGNQLCVALVPIQKWGDWQSALRRKEIDLFIGSATATDSRETNGIRFTPGYLAFESRVYGHAADFVRGGANFRTWLKAKRTVGVIDSSTNETLLDELCKDRNPKHDCDGGPIVKVKFPSFPAMEHAMDLGEIDGVLIDETFVDHTDWIPLDGLRAESAWTRYINGYIGSTRGREEVAIAVGVDDAKSSGVRGEELYHALKGALAPDSPITQRYIPTLCKLYWKGSPNNNFCGNGSVK